MKENIGKRVVIFYASKSIGGGELLFARIAKYLFLNGYEVTILDFEDGFLRGYLINHNIAHSHILFTPNDKYELNNYDYCITGANSILFLKNLISLNEDCKILLWVIYPKNLIELTLLSKFYFSLPPFLADPTAYIFEKQRCRGIKELIVKSYNNNGLIFIDGQCYYRISNFFRFDLPKRFIGFPVETVRKEDLQNKKHERKKGIIQLTWVSRFTKEKVYPLIVLCRELNSFGNGRFVLNIVGEGAYEEKLKEQLLKYVNVEKIFFGKIPNNEIYNRLNHVTDIYFGMGTSVIDFCGFGKPSVFVSYLQHYGVQKEQKYSWAHEMKDYNLLVDRKVNNESKSLINILQEYNSDKQNSIGIKCFEYYEKNYKPEVVIKDVIKILNNLSFTYKDLSSIELDLEKPARLKVSLKKLQNFLENI